MEQLLKKILIFPPDPGIQPKFLYNQTHKPDNRKVPVEGFRVEQTFALENRPAIGIKKTEYKPGRKGQGQIKLYCHKA